MKSLMCFAMMVLFCLSAAAQTWDIVSPFDDYQKEGWNIFQSPRKGTSVKQNADGTVTVRRMDAESDTVYLQHDTAWVEPTNLEGVESWSFTYEFRLKVDEIGGANGGTDSYGDRSSIYPLKNNPFTGKADSFSNGRTWLCSYDKTSVGSRYFNNPLLPKAELDMTQFHVLTFVCSLDYFLLQDKLDNQPDVSFGEAFEDDAWPERALGDHSPWTLYIDRDFSQPALENMPGSGWNGWDAPAVDDDGVMQIGFQGTTKGQITLDYFRTGNGVILDPKEPTVSPVELWPLF